MLSANLTLLHLLRGPACVVHRDQALRDLTLLVCMFFRAFTWSMEWNLFVTCVRCRCGLHRVWITAEKSLCWQAINSTAQDAGSLTVDEHGCLSLQTRVVMVPTVPLLPVLQSGDEEALAAAAWAE